MADRVGQQFGNYRLVALLGQGGFAEVYLGQHVRLNLQAAIKVLHTHLTGQEAKHFQQEAETIATLMHPLIVRILDYDVQNGMPFLVMDYAPGGSLRRRHPKGSVLPVPQIVSYVKQVASSLQYAHERKFIHRDVKPENMLVGRHEEVLLSDFGLAALAHSSASLSTQEAMGTLPYMAPEQIEGHPRPASDQYALSVVVYEWLCGSRPFEGSATEVMVQQLTMPPPPLHERIPTIPPALEQVVLRALAKDHKQRFASVHDYATALQRAVQESISAPTAEPANPYLTVPMVEEEPSDTAKAALRPEPMGKVSTHVTPLVGRQLEWGRLQAVWQSASAGHPHLLVLSGEAGIGKTRLAEELFGWVAQQDLSTARATCYAVEGEVAYAPVGFWLRSEAIHSRLSSLPALWLSEVARVVPQILVERPGLPPPGPLTESWQRQRLFEALARAILAARQPLLLLLDDLQWCDQESLAWLHYLLRFDPTARLLIVGTLRVEELTDEHPLQSWLATLRREGRLTQITLEGLSAAETAALAAQLAGHDLDPDAAIRLYQETDGNALFVVETMRMAHEQVEAKEGHAPAEPGSYQEVQEVRVLPTIQAVITARLAKLSPQARELVAVAAVIGRAFSFEVLAEVSKRKEDELLEALDELWQRRILQEAQGESYDFSHARLREVAYAELRPPRRRLLHRRVAEAQERVYADRLDPVSGDIAAHYEQAGIVERAVVYYQRAAEVAERVYANADAISFYRRSLPLLERTTAIEDKQEEAAHFYERIGDLLKLIGQHDEAQSAYESALAHVSRHEHIWQARLHRKIGWLKGWKEEERREELHYYDLAETLLESEPSERTSTWWEEWIEIQLIRMWAYYGLAKLPQLKALVEKVRPSVERYGKPMQRAVFFARLTLAGYLDTRYMPSEETLHYHQVALAAIQELGDLNAIAEYRFQLGFCYLWRNELGNAEGQLQTALDSAKQVGDLLLQSRCLTYLTITYRKRRQIEKVREYASQALAIATRLSYIGYIAMARGNMSWVAWREGNILEAQKHAQAGLEAFDGAGEPFEWTVLWPLIGVAVVQQQLADAIKYVRMLLVPEQQRLPDALTADLEQAIQAWDSDQEERARTELQQAIALAQEMGYL